MVIAFLLDALHLDVLVGSGRSVGVGLVLGNRLLGSSYLLLRWPENFLLGGPDCLLGGPDLAIVAILDIDHLSPGGGGDRFLVFCGLALKQQEVVGVGGRLGLLQLVMPDQLVGVRFGGVAGDDPVDGLFGLLVGLLVVGDNPVDDLVGLLLAGGPAPVAVVVGIVEVPDFLVLKQVAVELTSDVILVLLPEQIEVFLVDVVGVAGVVHFGQGYSTGPVVLNIVVFSVEVDPVLQTVQQPVQVVFLGHFAGLFCGGVVHSDEVTVFSQFAELLSVEFEFVVFAEGHIIVLYLVYQGLVDVVFNYLCLLFRFPYPVNLHIFFLLFFKGLGVQLVLRHCRQVCLVDPEGLPCSDVSGQHEVAHIPHLLILLPVVEIPVDHSNLGLLLDISLLLPLPHPLEFYLSGELTVVSPLEVDVVLFVLFFHFLSPSPLNKHLIFLFPLLSPPPLHLHFFIFLFLPLGSPPLEAHILLLGIPLVAFRCKSVEMLPGLHNDNIFL